MGLVYAIGFVSATWPVRAPAISTRQGRSSRPITTPALILRARPRTYLQYRGRISILVNHRRLVGGLWRCCQGGPMKSERQVHILVPKVRYPDGSS